VPERIFTLYPRWRRSAPATAAPTTARDTNLAFTAGSAFSLSRLRGVLLVDFGAGMGNPAPIAPAAIDGSMAFAMDFVRGGSFSPNSGVGRIGELGRASLRLRGVGTA